MGYSSKIISLTLPKKLLAQIDRLAKRDLSTRSDIMRQAALKYVRESGIDGTEPKKVSSPESKSKLQPQPA